MCHLNEWRVHNSLNIVRIKWMFETTRSLMSFSCFWHLITPTRHFRSKNNLFMLVFSFTPSNHRRRDYSLCFFLIVACLLLGITNATNTTAANNEQVVDIAVTATDQLGKNLNEQSTTEATTTTTVATNASANATDISIFHKPKNMSDVRRILLAFVQLLAQAFIVVSCKHICSWYP